MSNFWEGLGGKLADQWVAALLTPAFAFWLGGFVVWILHFGLTPLNTLVMQLSKLSPIVQGALLVGGLLVVVVSSSAVQRLDLWVLRCLEGYWPRWLRRLQSWLAGLKYKYYHKKRERFDILVAKERQASLPDNEYSERVSLSLKLREVPEREEDYMPTKLGNILRAAENHAEERYGLVTNISWPHLWLLLSDGNKKEISEARATLDTAARIFLWSLLFLVWTIWAWWVPLVTLVIAIWAYRSSLSAALTYGNLLEASYDLYRFELYEALRFPPPKGTAVEKANGEDLTTYLLYGRLATPITFHNPNDTKQEHQTKGGHINSTEENKALDRRFTEEVWNRGNLAVIDELLSADYNSHDATIPDGSEGFKQFVLMYRGAFPDMHLIIEDQVAEGDTVVSRWMGRGTHRGELMGIPPTGKQVTVTGININRIANGKFVEGWTNFDTLGLLQQLGGVLPQEQQSLQVQVQGGFPRFNWPTSKPGPQAMQPPPGQKPMPGRTDQVVEIGYNQETSTPVTNGPLLSMPGESLQVGTAFDQEKTAQEALKKRKRK